MPDANRTTTTTHRPDLLSVRETAAEKQVSPQTVLRWIRLGRLPAQRMRGTQRWFIDRRDIDALIENSP